MVSIVAARGAALVLVGCHDGVMTSRDGVSRIGIRARCCWSLSASTPMNHGKTRSRAYVLGVGGGRHLRFDEPSYSRPETVI